MYSKETPGFRSDELEPRYATTSITEDAWHTFGDKRKHDFICRHLNRGPNQSPWLLNAGCGVHRIVADDWNEVCLDLFPQPIRHHPHPVRATVERLPFASSSIGAVVCIGEVLGYCDPTRALAEFSRVLEPSGALICDYGNSRS